MTLLNLVNISRSWEEKFSWRILGKKIKSLYKNEVALLSLAPINIINENAIHLPFFGFAEENTQDNFPTLISKCLLSMCCVQYSQLVQHGQALPEVLPPLEDPKVNKLKRHGDLWMFLQMLWTTDLEPCVCASFGFQWENNSFNQVLIT